MKKRIIMNIIIGLCFLMLPLTAESEIVDSGKCGYNDVSWELDDEGVLTISGTGSMYNFSAGYYTQPSWRSAKKVIIQDGITNIGACAFAGCDLLTEVIIPNTVTSIDTSAFGSCSTLQSIFLPSSINNIGGSAFYNCSSLTSIEIPQSVNSIGNGAFTKCSSLKNINVSSDNPTYSSLDGVLFTKDQTSLISFPMAKTDNYTIPNGVKKIQDSAFNECTNLKVITLPEGMSEIGDSAFYNCSDLETINIPNSLSSIGVGAFANCSSLTNIAFPETMEKIGSNAFYKCSTLRSVVLPQNVTNYGFGIFRRCPQLRYLDLPDNITIVSEYDFENCSSLINVSIPEGVVEIGFQAFAGCTNLIKLEIPHTVNYIGNQSFLYCSNLSTLLFNHSIDDTIQFHEWSSIPFSTEIYCYEYSDVDYWATNAGYNSVYLDNVDFNEIRTVSLSDDFKMPINTTQLLYGSVFPLSDNPSIVWTSSNPSIVSVDNGIVTAHKIGSATINLSVEEVSDSINITVYQMADSYDLSPSETWIVAKDTIQLSLVDIEPEGSDISVSWSSSNIEYATVDSIGLVTTKKPNDEAIIISADSENDIHRECLLHICYPVTAIELESTKEEMLPDSDLQLIAHVTMRTQSCNNHLVTFTSSNPDIATVDENGLIHSVKHGTTTITVESASGITASKEITVLDVCEVDNGEIVNHLWGDVDYNWSNGNTAVTATRICQRHAEHVQTETVTVTSQEAKAATCTEMGETTYTSAEFENEAFEVQTQTLTDIPALGHDPVHHEAKAATCTEIGWDAYETCTRCDHTTYVEIPALGHDLVQHEAKAATCTEIGWDAYDTCSRCDYSTYVEIPALGHDWDTPSYTWYRRNSGTYSVSATCICKRDGMSQETIVMTTSDITKPATCTEMGETTYTAEFSGDIFSQQTKTETNIPALGHDWGEVAYEWSADNYSITATHTCKNDVSHTETETVSVLVVIVSPTDETKGSVTYTSAEFSKEGFIRQTKSIEILALNNMFVLRLPNMLASIEDEAFENLACEAIIIPQGCTSVGHYAFRNCKNLKYIKAPANLEIPVDAFEGCGNVVIDRVTE